MPTFSSMPLIIGHRGAAAVAPENTLISFEHALAGGADGIEFDVRLARDEVPVVIHDSTLHRTALHEDVVAHLSSSELSEVDVGTWFNRSCPLLSRDEYAQARIPTLKDVFEKLHDRRCLFYVEMKCDGGEAFALAAQVARLVQTYSLHDRAVVESFALNSIREIKRLDSNIRTAALFDRQRLRPIPSKRWIIAQAEGCGADELALHRTLTYPRITQEAARRGMRTVVWTVDNPGWIRRAVKYGLHALITNNPARMRLQRDVLFPV